jgi:DNA polymerase-3 subunit gamma/tau
LPYGALFVKTRARKKKTLTDHIELLPFPEQSLREKKEPPKIKAEVKNIPEEKPKPKPIKKAKLKTEHLSIKQILEKEKEAQNKKEVVLPREKVDIQKAMMLWRQYAYSTKDKGMETYYNALVKRDPLFESNEKIKIIVDNQIQVEVIKPLINELISFLREKLNNHFIEVQIELSEAPEEDVKFLNGKDKFDALAEKNPKLVTLKNLFKLDIDY